MSNYLLPVESAGSHFVISNDWIRAGLDPIPESELINEISSSYEEEVATLLFDGALHRVQIFVNLAEGEYSYVRVNSDGQPLALDESILSRNPGSEVFSSYFAYLTKRCEFSESILPEQRTRIDTDYLERDCAIRSADGTQTVVRGWLPLLQLSRVLLVGNPGVGKTTLLRKIAISLSRMPSDSVDFLVPVYVKLREWHEKGGISRIIRSELSKLAVEDFDSEYESLVNGGRLIYLLDGYDEVAFEVRQEVWNEIRQFMDRSPSCRYVISTRPSARPVLGGDGLDEVTLLEMNELQTKELCWRRLPDATKPWAPFWNRLVNEPDVTALATTPLLLTLLVARFIRDSLSPHFVGEVVMLALEALTDEWDSVRGVRRTLGSSLSPKVALDVLRRLASVMSKDSADILSDDHCLRVLNTMTIPDSSLRTLNQIEAQSGLLRRAAPDSWRFSHRIFQDYLQAAAISKGLDSAGIEMTPEYWRFVCAEASDPSPLLRIQGVGPYDERAIVLATSALAQRLVVSKDVVHGFCLSAIWLLLKILDQLQIEMRSEGQVELAEDNERIKNAVLVRAKSEIELFNFSTFISALRNTRDGYASAELSGRLAASEDEKVRILLPFILGEGRLRFRPALSRTEEVGLLTLSDG